jgi:hypothetical protein
MNTKTPASTICLLFLFCALPLYGQQTNPGARRLPPQCMGRPVSPHGAIPSVCQLVPRPTKVQQESNELPPSRDRGTYITFDAPGAGTGPSEGTYAYMINDLGVIVGGYFDSSFGLHGFIRTPDGRITAIDVSGAEDTNPAAINIWGEITGLYGDDTGNHGFLRSPGGAFTAFDPLPGSFTYTSPTGINDLGVIAGEYVDSSFMFHGFVRSARGSITSFDPPGSTDTFTGGINLAGMVTGIYGDQNEGHHGYVRNADGRVTSFDVPGSFSTEGVSINLLGAITGGCADDNGSHGFLRGPDGNIATFDVPGAANGTDPASIDLAGDITGSYYDANNVAHGFLRDHTGAFTTLDAPGAGTGTFQGTFAGSINVAGVITGYFYDSNNAVHSFVRIPR